MPAKEIAGTILSNMGPGLLSGVGQALEGDGKPKHFEPKAPEGENAAEPNSFKDGGTVNKTGLALVHKGEKVIPAKDSGFISHHRAVMHLNKGGLHKALGMSQGDTIPDDKLEAAKTSTNPHVAKMAEIAQAMKG